MLGNLVAGQSGLWVVMVWKTIHFLIFCWLREKYNKNKVYKILFERLHINEDNIYIHVYIIQMFMN